MCKVVRRQRINGLQGEGAFTEESVQRREEERRGRINKTVSECIRVRGIMGKRLGETSKANNAL